MKRGLPDPDRVLAQLEQTRQIMERARGRIEQCDDVRAGGMLKSAFGMQERAESSFRNERYIVALQLTTGARERVLRALRTCRLQENFQDSAEQALRRTDEAIGRARDLVRESGSERGRRALSRAVETQERATEEYRAGHLESSLRLTQTARAFAYRAQRQSGGRS